MQLVTPPRQSQGLLLFTLPDKRGWMLTDEGMTICYLTDSKLNRTGSEISIVRLNANGEETAGLSMSASKISAVEMQQTLDTAGIRAGAKVSFDAACATIEGIASELKIEYRLFGPALSCRPIADCDLSQLRMLSPDTKNSANQIDPLTRMPGKALLLRNESLLTLSERLAGNKTIAFLDFNNMGLANVTGLEKEVDAILKNIGDVGKKAFINMKYQMVRLGGDEFAIVIAGSADETGAALGRFRQMVSKLREESFSQKPTELLAAETRAARRALMRGTLSRYKTEINTAELGEQGEQPFEGKQFRDWVVERLRDHSPGFLPSREITGALVLRLATAELALASAAPVAESPRVMTFSIGAVAIGSSPTVEDITRALSLAEKEIHRQKECPNNALLQNSSHVPVASLAEIQEITLRKAELTVIANNANTADRNLSARQEFQQLNTGAILGTSTPGRLLANAELRRALALDPSVGAGVLRYNLIMDAPLGVIIIPAEQKTVAVFSLDVNHFGVLNNQLGYNRADELIAKIAQLIRNDLPGAVLIRKDGGKLIVLTETKCEIETLEILRNNAELAIRECVNDAVIAEYQIRLAQKLFDADEKGTNLLENGIRRARLSTAIVSGRGDLTIKEIVKQFEDSARIISHR